MTDDLVKRLRVWTMNTEDVGLRLLAADRIEEIENDLKLLRKQNREQRYEIERLKTPESERNLLGLAPIYVEKKDD